MIEGYKELLNSINLHKHLYEIADINYKYYDKVFYGSTPKAVGGMEYSDMPKGSRNMMDIADNIMKMKKWIHMRELEESIIKNLETKKQAIDECINQSDITVKVAQLRAMGMTQENVAELVERSTSTIKRIDKRIKNDTLIEL